MINATFNYYDVDSKEKLHFNNDDDFLITDRIKTVDFELYDDSTITSNQVEKCRTDFENYIVIETLWLPKLYENLRGNRLVKELKVNTLVVNCKNCKYPIQCETIFTNLKVSSIEYDFTTDSNMKIKLEANN